MDFQLALVYPSINRNRNVVAGVPYMVVVERQTQLSMTRVPTPSGAQEKSYECFRVKQTLC